MLGLFVTGTDTGVGKTFLTCAIARSLRAAGTRAGVYKPVCSGSEVDPVTGHSDWADLRALSRAVQAEFPDDWICPQKFHAPLAPPVAARRESQTVDVDRLRSGVEVWRDHVEVLLVEGVGGWLAPLADTVTCADLARDLGFPVLVVAANRLGCINHTLLTLESVSRSGLKVAGIVLNHVDDAMGDDSREANRSMIQQRTSLPVWGPVPYAPDGDGSLGFPDFFDWRSLCGNQQS